jgi:hypothetical protein
MSAAPVDLKTAPVDYRFSTSVDKSKVRHTTTSECEPANGRLTARTAGVATGGGAGPRQLSRHACVAAHDSWSPSHHPFLPSNFLSQPDLLSVRIVSGQANFARVPLFVPFPPLRAIAVIVRAHCIFVDSLNCSRLLTVVHTLSMFVLFLRFAQQCWTLYNEYLRCGKKQGVESKKCQSALNYAKQICTGDQVRTQTRRQRGLLLIRTEQLGCIMNVPNSAGASNFWSPNTGTMHLATLGLEAPQ